MIHCNCDLSDPDSICDSPRFPVPMDVRPGWRSASSEATGLPKSLASVHSAAKALPPGQNQVQKLLKSRPAASFIHNTKFFTCTPRPAIRAPDALRNSEAPEPSHYLQDHSTGGTPSACANQKLHNSWQCGTSGSMSGSKVDRTFAERHRNASDALQGANCSYSFGDTYTLELARLLTACVTPQPPKHSARQATKLRG